MIFGLLALPVAFVATILLGWGGRGGNYDFFIYYFLFGVLPYCLAYSLIHHLVPAVEPRHVRAFSIVIIALVVMVVCFSFFTSNAKYYWKFSFLTKEEPVPVYDLYLSGVSDISQGSLPDSFSSTNYYDEKRAYDRYPKLSVYRGWPTRVNFAYYDSSAQQLYKCRISIDEDRLIELFPRTRFRDLIQTPGLKHISITFGKKGKVRVFAGEDSDFFLQEHLCEKIDSDALYSNAKRSFEKFEQSQPTSISSSLDKDNSGNSIEKASNGESIHFIKSCLRIRDIDNSLLFATAINTEGRRLGLRNGVSEVCSDDGYGVVKTLFLKTKNAKNALILWRVDYDVEAIASSIHASAGTGVIYDFELFFDAKEQQLIRFFEYIGDQKLETSVKSEAKYL